MRAAMPLPLPALLLLTFALLRAAAPSPAGAQALPPSGAGVSNAYNQSFQNQNQFRGLQQQQTFDTNTQRLQNSTNQMYSVPRTATPSYGLHRGRGAGGGNGGGRPERER